MPSKPNPPPKKPTAAKAPPKAESKTPVLDKANRIFRTRMTTIAKSLGVKVEFESDVLGGSEAMLQLNGEQGSVHVLMDTNRGTFTFNGVWPTGDDEQPIKPTSAKPFRIAFSLADEDVARNLRTRYLDWYVENRSRIITDAKEAAAFNADRDTELKRILKLAKFEAQPKGGHYVQGDDGTILEVKHSHDKTFTLTIHSSAKVIEDIVGVIQLEEKK
jgi:hypothetical protein